MVAAVRDSRQNHKLDVLFWEGLTTATNSAIEAAGVSTAAVVGSVQVTGTFNTTTVTMEKSNDGTNFVAMSDLAGDAISFTAAGFAEFSTAAAYIRPQLANGSADDIDVTVTVWE